MTLNPKALAYAGAALWAGSFLLIGLIVLWQVEGMQRTQLAKVTADAPPARVPIGT